MQRLPLHLVLMIATAFSATPARAMETLDHSDAAMVEFMQRKARLAALGDTSASSKQLTQTIFSSRFEFNDRDCALDSDDDGLPDCVETGTGVFVGVSDTGTDPMNPDSDADALSDGDEVFGTADGLDLPALGVNPLRKDLLIEYDWFDDAHECGVVHSHRPTEEVLQRTARMFATAPVQNPDGSTGINLIQDAGQGGLLSGGNAVQGYDAILPGGFDDTFHAIKTANYDRRRANYFHYMLLAHRYNGGSTSSGYGEIIGDDSMVTLACIQTTDYAVRTIVHELGHNLGLYHGGFEHCNGKPNYNSLMNYRYQFHGLDTACNAYADGKTDGYSSGDRLSIDESAIDELQGVCGNPSIDWNGNGSVETGIALDLNPDFASSCGSSLSEIRDFNDWEHITFLGVRDVRGQIKSIQQEVSCEGAPIAHIH